MLHFVFPSPSLFWAPPPRLMCALCAWRRFWRGFGACVCMGGWVGGGVSWLCRSFSTHHTPGLAWPGLALPPACPCAATSCLPGLFAPPCLRRACPFARVCSRHAPFPPPPPSSPGLCVVSTFRPPRRLLYLCPLLLPHPPPPPPSCSPLLVAH